MHDASLEDMVDATRWARSAGIDATCRISRMLLERACPEERGEERREERKAAAAMAMLLKLRRVMRGDEDRLTFGVAIGQGGEMLMIEATTIRMPQGKTIVVEEMA